MKKSVIIATYGNPMSANIARTRLEDCEIPCHLDDENIVTVDPLLGIAVGGIKLRIPAQHAERAAEILADARDGSLERSSATEQDPEWEAMRRSVDGLVCPSCESRSIDFGTFFTVYALSVIAVFFSGFAPWQGEFLDAYLVWQPPLLVTLIFFGLVMLFLRGFPLRCGECGESGNRGHFE